MSRLCLSAPTTVYFNPAGSDTLGDGSIGNPWQTPQGAWNNLFAGFDLCGFPLTIQAGATGPFQTLYGGLNISGRLPGQAGSLGQGVVGGGFPPQTWGEYAPVTLRGNPAAPLNAFLYPPANSSAILSALSMTEGACLALTGFSLDSGVGLGDCIQLFNGASLDISEVLFGAAGQAVPAANHVSLAFGAHLRISGPYQINGGGQCHWDCSDGSTIYANTNGVSPIAITILNAASALFNTAFAYCDGGKIDAYGLTFSGAATGHSVLPVNGGVIWTNGAKNIPGSLGAAPTPANFAPGFYY